jgi:hypothetical protein
MAQSTKKLTDKDEAAAPQPMAGSVISPGQTVDLHQAAAPPAPEKPAAKAPIPEPPAAPPVPIQPAIDMTTPQEAQEEAQAEPPVQGENPEEGSAETAISWTASEFVAHDKSAGWYTLLIFGAAVFAAVVYLVTRDVISTGVVLVAAIILAVYGSHKPNEQQYTVDDQGVGIGQKRYSYDDFKSFAIATEGAFSSLVFMPLKRFAIPLTIYYAPEDEERIVNLLSNQLPLEEHRLDAVDNLMRRIRF